MGGRAGAIKKENCKISTSKGEGGQHKRKRGEDGKITPKLLDKASRNHVILCLSNTIHHTLGTH